MKKNVKTIAAYIIAALAGAALGKLADTAANLISRHIKRRWREEKCLSICALCEYKDLCEVWKARQEKRRQRKNKKR